MQEDDLFEEEPEDSLLSGMGLLTVVLPFAATIVSLVFGMLIGGAAVWIVKPVQRPVEFLRTASLAELQLVCEPVVEETRTQLTRVKEEIDVLKDEVVRKTDEVSQLEAQLAAAGRPARAPRSGSSSAAAAVAPAGTVDTQAISSELARTRERLAEAKLQIRMLTQVKDQLVDQLTATQQRLTMTEADLQAQSAIVDALRDENVELKDDVIVQRWFRMITESQLDICEKGGRKRTESCRQAVVTELSAIKREFVHCIRSNQATPSVEEVDRGRAELPHFARTLDQSNKYLSGWYLQLCDPTLPEVTLPSPSAAARLR